jgi:N-acetyltransferase
MSATAPFLLQPVLENDQILLLPLQNDDFEAVYQAASDPLIWEQHPNKDRWKRAVFATFFEGAIQSGGAFKIMDKATDTVAGSTRIYDYDPEQSLILIGYTFYARAYWGKGINLAVKQLMLDYLFQYVEKVHFHIGALNVRSQVAIGRLGAQKVGEQEVAYFGEPPKLNFVYEIKRSDWKLT